MDLSQQQSPQNSDYTRPEGAAVSIHHVVTQYASEPDQVPTQAQEAIEQESPSSKPKTPTGESLQPEDMFGDKEGV